MTRQVPLITIIGKSRAGKTTLMEQLITELKRRGYRVGTIKHHSHPGFEIDLPGKDSWRHAQAGSDHVVIASPDRIASYRSLEHELALDDIACGMTDVDIILTEGYLQAGKPTIQVIREASGLELIGPPEQCFAIATDAQLAVETPCYGLNDFMGLSNLLERLFLSEPSASALASQGNGRSTMNEENVRTEEFNVNGDAMVDKIKELVHEGNIRRVSIRNEEGKTLVDLPLTLGVAGAILAPQLAALGAIAVLVAKCTIVVERVEE